MDDGWRRMILEFRSSKPVFECIDGRDSGRYAAPGSVTPDHVIRTKLEPTDPIAISGAVTDYARGYQTYFKCNDRRKDKLPLDQMPRVVLAPGLGLFGPGKGRGPTRMEILDNVPAP